MELLEDFIKYDKQLTEICDFFNDENIYQLEENNKNRMALSANLLKLIDFLKVHDLNTPSNFGKKNNKIFCIDLENHNQNISFYDLKVFLEENNKNFIEIVNEYPELFYLIKR